MSEEEEMSETELFVNNKGQPIRFSIRICTEKAMLDKLIRQGAGELTSDISGPHTIRLIPEDDSIVKSHGDSFWSKYIYDCVQQGRLLPLENYRAHKKSKYTGKISVMDIMMGVHSWDECERSGEKEEQNMGDFGSCDLSANYSYHPEQSLKISGKRNYTFKEQRAIVDYIVENKVYNDVKGIKLWKIMEEKKVCPGRTYQSMKEHYTKKIIKNLNQFKLPVKVAGRLYCPFSKKSMKDLARMEDDKSDESTYIEESRTQHKCTDTIEKYETSVNSSEEISDEVSSKNEGTCKVVDSDKQQEIKDQSTQKSQVVEEESLDSEWQSRYKGGPSGLSKQMAIERKQRGQEATQQINEQNIRECEVVRSHAGKINPIVKTGRNRSEEQLTEQESELNSQQSSEGKLIHTEDKERDMHRESVQERKEDKIMKCNNSEHDNVGMSHSTEEQTSFVQKGQTIDSTQEFNFALSENLQSNSGTEDNHNSNLLQAENSNTSLSAVPASEDGPNIQASQENVCTRNGMGKELIERNSGRSNIKVSSTHNKSMVSIPMSAFAVMNQNTSNYQNTQEMEMQSNIVSPPNITVEDIEDMQMLLNDCISDVNTDINITSDVRVNIPKTKVVSLESNLKSSCESEYNELCSDSNSSSDIVPSSAQNSCSRLSYSNLGELAGKDDDSSKTSDKSTELFDLNGEKTDKDDLNKKGASISVQSVESEVLIHRSVQTVTRKYHHMLDGSQKEVNTLRGHRSLRQELHCFKDEYPPKSNKIQEFEPMTSSTPSDPASSIDSYSGRYDRTFNLKDGCLFGAIKQKKKSSSYIYAVKQTNKEPYTIQEDLRILRYIDRMRDYGRVGGRELWQEMESHEGFSNRSWHGLKERFRKRIFPRLHTYLQFGLSQETVRRFQARTPFTTESIPKAESSYSHRRPYSHKEEKLIVQFIVRTKRYSEVGAKAMWEIMALTVPGLRGRTWLSLKERYRRHIINHIGVFGLTEEQIQNFKKPFERKNWKHQPKLHLKNRKLECTTVSQVTSSSEDSYEGDSVDETDSDRSDIADGNTKQQLHRRRKLEDSDEEESVDETDSDRSTTTAGSTVQRIRSDWKSSDDTNEKKCIHESDSDSSAAAINKKQLHYKRKKSKGIEGDAVSSDRNSIREQKKGKSRKHFKSSNNGQVKASTSEGRSRKQNFSPELEENMLRRKRSRIPHTQPRDRIVKKKLFQKRKLYNQNEMAKLSPKTPFNNVNMFSQHFQHKQEEKIKHTNSDEKQKKNRNVNNRAKGEIDNKSKHSTQKEKKNDNENNEKMPLVEPEITLVEESPCSDYCDSRDGGNFKANKKSDKTYHERNDAVGGTVNDEVGGTVNDAVGGTAIDEVGGTINEMGGTANDEVGGTVNDEVGGTENDEVGSTANNEVGGNANDEVGGTVNDEVGSTANDEVGGTANDELSGTVNDEVGGTANDEVGGTANDEVGGTINDELDKSIIKSKQTEASTVNVADAPISNLLDNECPSSPGGNIISKNDKSTSQVNVTPPPGVHTRLSLDFDVKSKNINSIFNMGSKSLSDTSVEDENTNSELKSGKRRHQSSKRRHQSSSPYKRITRQSSDMVRTKLRKKAVRKRKARV